MDYIGKLIRKWVVKIPRNPRNFLKSSFFHVITQGIDKENIFKENIYTYFRSKNNRFNIPINESKKRRLLPIFRKKKN